MLSSIRSLLVNAVGYVNATVEAGETYTSIKELNDFIHNLIRCAAVLAAVVFLVLMPTYVALSKQFSIYENNYAWIVSSMYLSGFEPAMTLFFMYLLFSVLLFVALFRMGHSFKKVVRDDRRRSTVTEYLRSSYKQYLGLMGVALFNFVVVLAVNVGYIWLSTRVDPTQLSWLELLLAVFKFVWNDVVVRRMTRGVHRLSSNGVDLTIAEEQVWNSRYLSFNAYVLLFNTIGIPCLATAFVSSECFYNVYVRPLNVVSTITYQSCTGYENVVAGILSPNCTSYTSQELTTSYLPPFIYRYQCASTLVTTYVVVYVYKFILSAFVRPFVVLTIIRLDESLSPDSKLRRMIGSFEYENGLEVTDQRGGGVSIFQSDQFNLRIIMFLSVLVTFGVMFPPLAVMICISVVVQCFCTQLILGRFIAKQTNDKKTFALISLNKDTRNTSVMFMQTVYLIGGPAAFFYSYFLFDTYGDQVGARKAIWMTVTMFVFTILCMIAFKVAVESNTDANKVRSESNAVELVDHAQKSKDVESYVVNNPAYPANKR